MNVYKIYLTDGQTFIGNAKKIIVTNADTLILTDKKNTPICGYAKNQWIQFEKIEDIENENVT